MKLKRILLAILACAFSHVYSQYPPPAGQDGSTAIHRDSVVFVSWATACTVERGPMNIAELSLGPALTGSPDNVPGLADNQVVSLGDGGVAVLTFENPISNGTGPDFAVFENGFSDDYLELAFVEVSSNGVDFFRFGAVSLTQTDEQVGAFGSLDATRLHNLAGKYRVDYGTPFDLDELAGAPDLDKNRITHIRIVDVVGSIDDDHATFDSQGNKVNDPWPTAFESSGFDLDAVGVIHQAAQSVYGMSPLRQIHVFPNPACEILYIDSEATTENMHIMIREISGKTVLKQAVQPSKDRRIEIPLENLAPGMYIVTLSAEGYSQSIKVIRR